MDQVIAYIDKQASSSPDFSQEWSSIKEFYEKKLWYQLTCSLLQNLNNASFCAKTDLQALNDTLINDIKSRISPKAFAEMTVRITEVLVTKGANDELCKLLIKVRDESMVECLEGKILCSSQLGEVLLAFKDSKKLPEVREIIEVTEKDLDKVETISNVHSRFYQLSCKYYEAINDNANYYKEALKFLGCTDFEKMPLVLRQQWAYSIGIASLVGEKVLNYGELMTHGILESLKGDSQRSWLVDLINAFSHGNLAKIKEMKPVWLKNDILKAHEKRISEKALLLCLVELLFNRPANSRSVGFGEIAKATGLDMKEVDNLLMRALSLHLIEGKIDDINQSITLTWLQPRVLDNSQIKTMKGRLETWLQTVGKMKNLIEVDAEGIVA